MSETTDILQPPDEYARKLVPGEIRAGTLRLGDDIKEYLGSKVVLRRVQRLAYTREHVIVNRTMRYDRAGIVQVVRAPER